MYPYPSGYPAEEMAVLLSEVTGGKPPLVKAMHAGWVVAGFALSQGAPDPSAPVHADMKDVRAALAKHLHPLHTARIGDGHIIQSIPWNQVASLLVQLLQGYLKLNPTAA